jgi:hypothetical protein
MRFPTKYNPVRTALGVLLPFTFWTIPGSVRASAQTHPDSPISAATTQLKAYLGQLADLHCRETVTQQKIASNGHVEASEHEEFDYLIMMSGNGDEFQLNESRVAAPDSKHKLLSMPMLVTNGMSTVLLVFHPYYRDGFQFQTGAEENIDGRPAVPIHFSHIPGRRSPAALALRGREYPLDLEGTAWLDKETGQIVQVEAGLLHDMSDVGLQSLKIRVTYKATNLGANGSRLMLPAMAVVDVTTPRQHWRNTHEFDRYRSFSTDVQQDPNIKVRAENPTSDSSTVAQSSTSGTKEKQ